MAYLPFSEGATTHGRSARAPATGTRGMVASAHPYATGAGLDALQAGGNAIDAAVAVAATLNVVEPYMSGMAGVGVALVCIASEDRTRVLNFSGHTPKAAAPELYDNVSVETGPLAPLVPGNIGGWMMMHREYGRIERKQLFVRAIEYAVEGFALTPFNASTIRTQIERVDGFSSSAAALELDRSNIVTGALLRQPLLAESLSAVADGGVEEFYKGRLGDRLIDGLRAAGGIMTREELAEYSPRWQEPLTSMYRGLEVRVPPPNSAGFQIAETLNILDQHDLADYGSSETLHTLVETAFKAADDRAKYAGDPAEVDVPLVRLLSDEYAREIAASLDPAQSAGLPTERWSRSRVDRPPVDFTKPYVSGLTTHFATADAEGNVVTITQTLGEAFGSGLAPEGTGLFLNNMSKWFDIDPALGSPNLIGGGKEVDFCVAPVQLFDVSGDSARIRLSIGTPGSYGILHTSAQMIHHFVDAGMNIQEAIEAPRFRFYDDGTCYSRTDFRSRY